MLDLWLFCDESVRAKDSVGGAGVVVCSGNVCALQVSGALVV